MTALTLADAFGGISEDRAENGDNGEGGVCVVCSDEASGKHYGVMTCNGCKGFFRRSVRAPKPYECRSDGKCQIDKMARNGCRACRFRRCLEVGMNMEAIRPDRDKTGKRMSSQSSSQPSIGSSATDVLSEVLLAAVKRARTDPPDEEIELNPIHNPSAQSSQIDITPMEDVTLATLKACEDQVYSMVDSVDAWKEGSPSSPSFLEVIAHPSLLTHRTPLATESDGRIATSHDLSMNLRRAFVLLLDFINSLRPIADFALKEKGEIVRSSGPAFMLFQVMQHSIKNGAPSHCILLSLGETIAKDAKLFDSLEENESKSHVVAEMRVKAVMDLIFDQLLQQIREMKLTSLEASCLRSILLLEPVYSISALERGFMATARCSIVEALRENISSRNSNKEAESRLTNILLFTCTLHRVSQQLKSSLQFCKDHGILMDPLLEQYLLDESF